MSDRSDDHVERMERLPLSGRLAGLGSPGAVDYHSGRCVAVAGQNRLDGPESNSNGGRPLVFAFFVIISIVADAIAGERERHTLETLLASRMPDHAILLGKLVIVTLYGWSVMVVGLLLGAVVSSLAYGQGQLLFYPIDMLLFTLVLGLLVGALGASLGVLISLRMSTVRQAQQTLSIGTIVLGVAAVSLLRAAAQRFLCHLYA